MIKKVVFIVLIAVIILAAGLAAYIYTAYVQTKTGVGIAMKRFTPGTAEYETYKRWNERSKEYRIHENKAMEFENKGEYELAIGEYRKTLKSEYNKWITHRHLLDLYEKAGHNDLAIQEIDWLLSQKPSRQVIDELNARKERLQSLPKSTAAE